MCVCEGNASKFEGLSKEQMVWTAYEPPYLCISAYAAVLNEITLITLIMHAGQGECILALRGIAKILRATTNHIITHTL